MLTNKTTLTIRETCRNAAIPIVSLFRAARLSDTILYSWERNPAAAQRDKVQQLKTGVAHMIAELTKLDRHLDERLGAPHD